jgi:hypothetical protein
MVVAQEFGRGFQTKRRRDKSEHKKEGEFCKHDTVYGGLQTFGTAVVAIESVALKSPSFCKFSIARS